jgi:Ribbon-helix-helix protein, copG family
MTEEKAHGHTRSGRPLTGAEVGRLAAEAERGYETDELIARRGKRGRPTLGSGPAVVESVRLGPEMREQLSARAAKEGVSTSEIIRAALREYLRAS